MCVLISWNKLKSINNNSQTICSSGCLDNCIQSEQLSSSGAVDAVVSAQSTSILPAQRKNILQASKQWNRMTRPAP